MRRPAFLVALALLAAGAGAQGAPAAEPAVAAVTSVGVTVADLERSLAFYEGVLGFERVGPIEERAGAAHESLEGVFGLRTLSVRLRLGDEVLELVDYLAPEGRPLPVDSRSNDRWFQHVAIIVKDMRRAYEHLRAHGVEHASSGPQRLPDWNPNAGGIEAFYFKDPDHHVLEVLAFPPGKGDAKWHRPTDALFLGIDHTAIAVRDTDASLAFWRDTLGLAVVGQSENWGTEQEHLNNVFGARLRITTLRAANGPGVELLQYLAPTDGRPYPADARGNDLVHWETRLAAPALAGLEQRLFAARAPFVSPGSVAVDGGRALLVRDPDGHAVEIRDLSEGGASVRRP